jgi:hypothetical protein
MTPVDGSVLEDRQRLVLIAPSYGNPASRSRFRNTLEKEVSFVDGPVRDVLSGDEFEDLHGFHPSGAARFWGALSKHNSKMDRLATGDVVLFTGGKRVQAVGKLGRKLRNSKLADLLWKPDPKTGSWSNVYTVVGFRLVTDLTYEAIRRLANYAEKDVFQETRVPRSDQAEALIKGLALDIPTDGEVQEEEARYEARLLKALDSVGELSEIEVYHVDGGRYELRAKSVGFSRAEARLVAKYLKTLPQGQVKRLRLSVGWTDLYDVVGQDLIEAKRSAAHRYVREALGQLLDYAAHADQPIQRLTALLPEAPSQSDIGLLHRYGIDCLYWEGGDSFRRLEACVEARERIRAAWWH